MLFCEVCERPFGDCACSALDNIQKLEIFRKNKFKYDNTLCNVLWMKLALLHKKHSIKKECFLEAAELVWQIAE